MIFRFAFSVILTAITVGGDLPVPVKRVVMEEIIADDGYEERAGKLVMPLENLYSYSVGIDYRGDGTGFELLPEMEVDPYKPVRGLRHLTRFEGGNGFWTLTTWLVPPHWLDNQSQIATFDLREFSRIPPNKTYHFDEEAATCAIDARFKKEAAPGKRLREKRNAKARK